MNCNIKTYHSYTELAAAQGDFIPMHGETRPEPPSASESVITENDLSEPAAAALDANFRNGDNTRIL